MKIQILRIISLSSLILLGILGIFLVWGIVEWVEIVAKLMVTLGIIFFITALTFDILRRDQKK